MSTPPALTLTDAETINVLLALSSYTLSTTATHTPDPRREWELRNIESAIQKLEEYRSALHEEAPTP